MFTRSVRGYGLVMVALFVLAAVGGCTLFRKMAGKDTVDLAEMEVLSMSVDLRKEQKTICPLESTQVAVFVTVEDPDNPQGKLELETWEGGGSTRRNGKLDFGNFAFHSPQGSFDDFGTFQPEGGVLASVATEYEIDFVLKKRPDKFSFKMKYEPDYRCVTGSNHDGSAGAGGMDGNSGERGRDGAYGGEDAGGDGSDGLDGSGGSDGQDGMHGERLELYATFVKTEFYEKLLAVIVRSSREEIFLLAHPEQVLTFSADGGAGGSGGNGGNGGAGGNGGTGKPGGNAGDGGDGGSGGNGGAGGDGGSVELLFDERFPEIERMLTLSAEAGRGGGPGIAGYGGSGGMAFSGGRSGVKGTGGTQGQGGRDGQKGTVRAQPGDVSGHFSSIPGLEVLP